MDLSTAVSDWDVGTRNDLLSNRALQTLLEEGPDPGALISQVAQTGENPFWPTTTNDGEAHLPLQGHTPIGANELMEIGGFLHSGSDPIDVETYPPRLRPRVLQKGSKFASTIKIGSNRWLAKCVSGRARRGCPSSLRVWVWVWVWVCLECVFD